MSRRCVTIKIEYDAEDEDAERRATDTVTYYTSLMREFLESGGNTNAQAEFAWEPV